MRLRREHSESVADSPKARPGHLLCSPQRRLIYCTYIPVDTYIHAVTPESVRENSARERLKENFAPASENGSAVAATAIQTYAREGDGGSNDFSRKIERDRRTLIA